MAQPMIIQKDKDELAENVQKNILQLFKQVILYNIILFFYF